MDVKKITKEDIIKKVDLYKPSQEYYSNVFNENIKLFRKEMHINMGKIPSDFFYKVIKVLNSLPFEICENAYPRKDDKEYKKVIKTVRMCYKSTKGNLLIYGYEESKEDITNKFIDSFVEARAIEVSDNLKKKRDDFFKENTKTTFKDFMKNAPYDKMLGKADPRYKKWVLNEMAQLYAISIQNMIKKGFNLKEVIEDIEKTKFYPHKLEYKEPCLEYLKETLNSK